MIKNRILFLTKNKIADGYIAKKLELLGYEVFFSASLLYEHTTNLEKIPCLFSIVVFSETITSKDCLNFFSSVGATEVVWIRIDNSSDEKTSDRINHIFSNIELGCLREEVADWLDQFANPVVQNRESIIKMQYQHFFNDLSKTERKLLIILIQHKGAFVTRERLSIELWGTGRKLSSNLAQLSQLMQRIRTKWLKYDNLNELVTIKWKYGYRISNASFLEYVTIDDLR